MASSSVHAFQDNLASLAFINICMIDELVLKLFTFEIAEHPSNHDENPSNFDIRAVFVHLAIPNIKDTRRCLVGQPSKHRSSLF